MACLSFGLLMVNLYLNCVCVWQDDFLLIHYDKGPCRNKLGHSRASVIWHRTQVRSPSSSPPFTHPAACGHTRAPCLFLSFCLTHSHSAAGLYYLDSTIAKGQLDPRAATSVWWSVSCCFQLSLLCTPFSLRGKKKVYITKVLLYYR